MFRGCRTVCAASAAVLVILFAGTVSAADGETMEEARIAPAEEFEPHAAATPVIPAREDGSLMRWNVRPFLGGSTVKPGGINTFPEMYLNWWAEQMTVDPTALWYGAVIGPADEKPIRWAVVEGFTLGYQATPILEIAARVTSVRTQHGRHQAIISGAGGVMTDAWSFRSDVLMLTGGGGFKLTFTERTRAIVSLLLGIGVADASISHRRIWMQTGGATLAEAHADVRGTSFVPEFCANIEHDLATSLSAGVEIGYRFMDVGSFKYRRPANLYFLTSTYALPGAALRSNDGVVGADLGGLVVSFNLTARI